MTTNSTNNYPEAGHGEEPADSPHPEDSRCVCGALADRNGVCLKCRARATWQRRRDNRERRAARREFPSRPASRGSNRPHDRRPGR